MLKKIKIDGFKCFDHTQIALSNLTLLTGTNSSGKSSLIQALLFLMQQKENGQNPLNGKYVRLGGIEDVKNTITNARKIEVSIQTDEPQELSKVSLCTQDDCECKCTNPFLGKDFIYLSAERIGVEDTYAQNLEDEYRIGVHGEYTYDYLSQERLNKLKESEFLVPDMGKNLGNQVDYWLNYITGYTVTAERVVGTEIVRVSYQRTESGSRSVKPKHTGTGVTYVANVIIAALSCKKESLFVVENPEIHLHPKAQSRLLEFFCYLSARGLQIVIETHSDHIFNGIRKNIKKQAILKEQVSIYFFKLDETYLSRPIPIQIDGNGVIQNHEAGLFDQFDEDLDELLGL